MSLAKTPSQEGTLTTTNYDAFNDSYHVSDEVTRKDGATFKAGDWVTVEGRPRQKFKFRAHIEREPRRWDDTDDGDSYCKLTGVKPRRVWGKTFTIHVERLNHV